MSSVYLVEDILLTGAQWAVKELNLVNVPEAEQLSAWRLFQREAAILAKLNHPGLPRIIDNFVEPDGSAYIVMERIMGDTLDQLLGRRTQPLHLSVVLPLALQAAHVLAYLHRQRTPVVYRDLKPSNLMLTDSGRLRFIDFGIARFYDPKHLKDTQELGTPGFCAPEQYHGHSTPQSDIYALGVTIYYLLTLKPPQDFQFKFPPISDLISAPEPLVVCLERCLQIEPSLRYSSGTELRKALEAALRLTDRQADKATQPLSPALLALSKHSMRLANLSTRNILSWWKELLYTLFGSKRQRRQ